MVFVDGSNLLIELFKQLGADGLRADKPEEPYIQLADQFVSVATRSYERRGAVMIRRYWFASYRGDDEVYDQYRGSLRKYRFEPVLFKQRDGREKGVDIALAKEMLVNAFNQNFDEGFLVAGDEDYVGLVSETKRYGQVIRGVFFEHHLSVELKLSCDSFGLLQGPDYDDLIKRFEERRG